MHCMGVIVIEMIQLSISEAPTTVNSVLPYSPASEGELYHARGNSLFENRGDGTFADRGIESGTTMGRWAWGSLFVDINNDGWRDVYITNGFVTADNNNDL